MTASRGRLLLMDAREQRLIEQLTERSPNDNFVERKPQSVKAGELRRTLSRFLEFASRTRKLRCCSLGSMTAPGKYSAWITAMPLRSAWRRQERDAIR